MHAEFCKRTVTSKLYVQILGRLREKIRKKCPAWWELDDSGRRQFILHHDNASSHTAGHTLCNLHENCVDTMVHPPYSPDLAPLDFAVFPHLKKLMKGKRYRTVQELQDATMDTLRSISPEFWHETFDSWQHRMEKCIQFRGHYFEGQPHPPE